LSEPARFTPAARREFTRVLNDMGHAAAAERLKRVVEQAARRIGDHPALGRHELVRALPDFGLSA
jgi:plasmid stabilization system protein ParE